MTSALVSWNKFIHQVPQVSDVYALMLATWIIIDTLPAKRHVHRPETMVSVLQVDQGPCRAVGRQCTRNAAQPWAGWLHGHRGWLPAGFRLGSSCRESARRQLQPGRGPQGRLPLLLCIHKDLCIFLNC